jgi:FHS family glucose/mannose:H+ symporter-like MFS transporter
MALFSKPWMQRFGAVKATRIASLFLMVAIFTMGFSAQYKNMFWLFLSANIILGLATGILSITQNIIISNSTPDHLRQRFFSGLHSMYGLASFIAPVILSGLFHYDLDWRSYFMGLALIPLIHFVVSFRIHPLKYAEEIIETNVDFKTATSLGIILSFYVATEVMVSSRLSLYLHQVWSYQLDHASGELGLFFLLLLAGRLLFAFYTPKTDPLKIIKASALCTLILLILGTQSYPKLLPLSGLSMSIFFPCFLTWISMKYGAQKDILITVVMRFVGGMIVFMHVVFGALAEAIGIAHAFLLAIVLHLVVIALLLPKKSKSLDK